MTRQNDVDGLMSLMKHSFHDETTSPRLLDVHRINSMFYVASAIAVSVWLLLLAAVYWVLPYEREYLPQTEANAAATALVILVVSNLLIMMPFALRSRKQTRSGIMLAALITQFIAIVTAVILAYAPNVVLVDPVTHARVFMTRWTEWIPLAGLMTFFSEAVDLPKSKSKQWWPILASLCQSVSCLCGALLPLCPNMFCWYTTLFVSIMTWLPIFPRIVLKRRAFLLATQGKNLLELEQYDRFRFSYYLMLTCGCIWSVLVFAYFVNFALHRQLPVTHWLRTYPLAMIVDATFDVLAKAIYMKLIVDVHFLVFDSEGRTQRQLTELRSLLNVLWDSSSDVIIISVRYADKVTSMMSPSYPKLVGATLPPTLKGRKTTALMLETDLSSMADSDGNNGSAARSQTVASYVDSSEMPYGRVTRQTVLHGLDASDPEVTKAVGLIGSAWNRFATHDHNDSSLVMYPLQRIGGSKHKCEIKVSYHTNNSIIAVVRDVTERYRRFEAERRAHSEALARQRDAQSQTRFVRHEVKNGLLSGIELCDSLRNAMDELCNKVRASEIRSRLERSDSLSEDSSSEIETTQSITSKSPLTDLATRHLEDLDRTLHEVLDTVLAETMARDVIHEVYHPRLEHLDVKGYLANSGYGENAARFPVEIASGDSLPYLQLDPQLMRYIHRNAISNACKYGKPGGKVITKLAFRPNEGIFEMKVVNEPGVGHDELISMGEKATKAVFEQGTRLHPHLKVDDRYISSGDGAWIVQKCASTMGGTCGIQFESDETIFSFQCPAQPLHVANLPKTHDFEVPSDTWGIVIDDSKIQRKLMARILAHAGVDESRRHVLGESPTDIVDLGELLQKLLREHPNSRILCLVDENLDYDDRGAEHVVLSGSIAMKNIICQLTPSEESRLLVLVRSANDSADDVALYLSRTHGFFPKTTMQRDRVKEILAPLWAERFLTGKNRMTSLSYCSRTSSITDDDAFGGSDDSEQPIVES
ncbi:hypothetical protein MPSEU_001014100 [Mayamaea pseudoterrestris]|nr:hypothetical protein MPSEU_001014100 [Mayamaea pseudoterrestris]